MRSGKSIAHNGRDGIPVATGSSRGAARVAGWGRRRCRAGSGRRSEPVPAGGGDHRRVVGAHLPARQEATATVGGTRAEQLLAQQRVGRHPTAEHDALRPDLLGGSAGLGDEHVDDRRLEGGGDVGRRDVGVLADVVDDGRLEAAEAEVEPVVAHRPREADAVGIAVEGRGCRSPARPDTRGSRKRATLSNASPAASSIVWPSMR